MNHYYGNGHTWGSNDAPPETGQSRAELLAAAKTTWKYLDPMFAQYPLYLIPFSSLPAGVVDSDFLKRADAFTQTNGYQAFQSVLRKRGDDRGPGYVIAIDTTNHSEESYFMARVVHEAAHLVADTASGRLFHPGQPWAQAQTKDEQHGPLFIRAAVHLWHRSLKLCSNQVLDLQDVIYAENMNLGCSADYWSALFEEIKSTRIDEPLVPVLKRTPPAKFIALYARHAGIRDAGKIPATGSAAPSATATPQIETRESEVDEQSQRERFFPSGGYFHGFDVVSPSRIFAIQ